MGKTGQILLKDSRKKVLDCYSTKVSPCKKCPNTKFFHVRIFLYFDWIQENTNQKKLRIWTLFTQCIISKLTSIPPESRETFRRSLTWTLSVSIRLVTKALTFCQEWTHPQPILRSVTTSKENTLARVLFSESAGLKPATLLKRTLSRVLFSQYCGISIVAINICFWKYNYIFLKAFIFLSFFFKIFPKKVTFENINEATKNRNLCNLFSLDRGKKKEYSILQQVMSCYVTEERLVSAITKVGNPGCIKTDDEINANSSMMSSQIWNNMIMHCFTDGWNQKIRIKMKALCGER